VLVFQTFLPTPYRSETYSSNIFVPSTQPQQGRFDLLSAHPQIPSDTAPPCFAFGVPAPITESFTPLLHLQHSHVTPPELFLLASPTYAPAPPIRARVRNNSTNTPSISSRVPLATPFAQRDIVAQIPCYSHPTFVAISITFDQHPSFQISRRKKLRTGSRSFYCLDSSSHINSKSRQALFSSPDWISHKTLHDAAGRSNLLTHHIYRYFTIVHHNRTALCFLYNRHHDQGPTEIKFKQTKFSEVCDPSI
jgi:hypothetical protein